MSELTLAARVHDVHAGPARLLLLPTPVRDVISFRGSFQTAPDMTSDDDVVQSLTGVLLDKGTAMRDRFAIAEMLEGRGARLSFYSDGLRMGISGRALREDLPDVLELAGEILRQPAFESEQVEKAKTRAIAGVRRAREATDSQAAGALARRLYSLPHPNYVLTPEEEIARIEAVTPDTIRRFHTEHVGPRDLVLAFVGDVDPEAIPSTLTTAFDGWTAAALEPVFDASSSAQPSGEAAVEMADRRNLDVRMGHALDLRRDHEDYMALYTAVFALGGNFSSRLMQTVRDEQGLTYGISASIANVTVDHDGHLAVSVTLSQENLERGIAATHEQVERFVAEGIGDEELSRTQTTLAGRHIVGLATTGGIAARLLINAERGFDVGYLDRYPDLIHALTPARVTEVLRHHIRLGDLHTVTAGTLPVAV
ncbi:MAG: pitrilysin family protein [Rubricoccaceae bacterium]